MSNGALQDNMVKTRKDHICVGCSANIPKGSTARYQSGRWQGGFYSNYFCTPCDDYIDSLEHKDRIELFEYGFTPGEIGDWRREQARELSLSTK